MASISIQLLINGLIVGAVSLFSAKKKIDKIFKNHNVYILINNYYN